MNVQISPAATVPLVVDLDGTLLKSDLLIEAAFAELGREPISVLRMARALSKGKASLKELLAAREDFDPALLPYDEDILAEIGKASEAGRPVFLASASHKSFVEKIAGHLGLFAGWFASDSETNLAGEAKAKRLVEAFGEHGFDYIGNCAHDVPVWAAARNCLGVRVPRGVAAKLEGNGTRLQQVASQRPSFRDWRKLLRVHQYAKNLLVFVPLLTSHQFTLANCFLATLAAIAFSLCASSFYIINDAIDLRSDRDHPANRLRPLASGAIPLQQALLASVILFTVAALISLGISVELFGVLIGYAALTMTYSLWLKRKMIADVIALAALYSSRMVAGAVAIGVPISEWLLGFSVFMFIALALIKRYVELARRLDMNRPDPGNRNYQIADLSILASLAAAAGFNAITVFALYISSDNVKALYHRPQILWLICPVMIYWFARMLMLAHRRQMDHDPILFAITDKVSIVTLGLVCALMAIAA